MRASLRCCVRLGERFRSCVKLCETLGEVLSERLCERLLKRLCEMLDPDILQVYFRQASSRIQESLDLSQLPRPEKGLVS